MSYFKYVALDSKEKVISGFIESESLETAKEELHTEGFSIIKIEEKDSVEESEEKKEGDFPEFEFEAEDKMKQKIKGIIEEKDMFHAYKKLKQEHHLNVLWICSKDEKNEEIKQMQKENSAFLMEQRLKKEMEFFENAKAMGSGGFSKEIFGNLDDLDEINEEGLSKEQSKILSLARSIRDFLIKTNKSHKNFVSKLNLLLIKSYYFLLFSTIFFGAIYASALFVGFSMKDYSEKIFLDERLKFFSIFISLAFFFTTLKIYTIKRAKTLFGYLFFILWVASSTILFFNI